MNEKDAQLRDAMLRALEQVVEIEHTHVGVIANDGAVALVGFVRTPMQKRAAVQAAARVPGVAAVADELEVRPPGGPTRTDAEIAEDIAHWRQWAVLPPTLTATVRDGHVKLQGDVFSDEQLRDAVRVFGKIHGVRDVKSAVKVRTDAVANAREIQRRADDAVRRLADTDARSIHATIVDGTARLTGTVNSQAESVAAERAAWSVSGVTAVANEILVVT